MMRYLTMAAAAVVLASCGTPDQCIRREIFDQCLERAPRSAWKNDLYNWDNVVRECGSQAYNLSKRSSKQVPAQCRRAD